MQNLIGKIVVVTGAASGIGKALAKGFAREGAKLALADIDAAGLETIKQELFCTTQNVYTKVVDVSKAPEVEAFCEDVYKQYGRVDVLCNNAGIWIGGKIDNMQLKDWERIMATNFWGVIHGCHYFYPRMIKQGGGGHILNTSSGAGIFPVPVMTAYSTSKFAVQGFTENLRAEAALNGIGVTAICPGIIATDICANGAFCTPTARSTTEKLREKGRFYIGLRGYGPDKVAQRAIKAVKKNKAVQRITPETYWADMNHSFSRAYSIFLNRIATWFFLRWV